MIFLLCMEIIQMGFSIVEHGYQSIIIIHDIKFKNNSIFIIKSDGYEKKLNELVNK